MTLSNALPIQFWINGEETFNQKDVCGVTKVCFCQPWQCDDPIDVQFLEDTTFYSTIVPGLPTFVNHFGFSAQWTGSTSRSVTVGSFAVSDYLKGTLTNWPPGVYPGGSYAFNYNIDISSSPGFQMLVALLDVNADVDHPIAQQTITTTGPGTLSGVITLPTDPDYGNQQPHYVVIRVNNLGSDTRTFTINNNGFTFNSITPTPNQPETFNLSVNDDQGSEIALIPFTATALENHFLYSASFLPSDHGICGQEVTTIILGGDEDVVDSSLSSYSGWENQDIEPERPWLIPPFKYSSKFIQSPVLAEDIASGVTLTIKLTLGTSDPTNVKVHLLNSSNPGVIRQEIDFGSITTGINGKTIVTSDIFNQIEIECYHTTGSRTVLIESIQLSDPIGDPDDYIIPTFPNWTQDGNGYSWIEGASISFLSPANAFQVKFNNPAEISDTIKKSVSIGSLKPVKYVLDYLSTSQTELSIIFKNGETVVETVLETLVGDGSLTGAITVSSAVTSIELIATSAGVGASDFSVQDFVVTVYNSTAESDCLSIREAHPCTVAIEYTNNKDFNNLIYEGVSPVPTFRLRIPAVFSDQDDENPAEQEDTELSNGEIVRLWNKLELKRKLNIGFIPQYLHQKIQLILMHDNITIDEKQWIRRDPYEKKEGNRTYPLRRASVFLHDKDFIRENQL